MAQVIPPGKRGRYFAAQGARHRPRSKSDRVRSTCRQRLGSGPESRYSSAVYLPRRICHAVSVTGICQPTPFRSWGRRPRSDSSPSVPRCLCRALSAAIHLPRFWPASGIRQTRYPPAHTAEIRHILRTNPTVAAAGRIFMVPMKSPAIHRSLSALAPRAA